MSFDIGTVEIPCPTCREPIAVTGTATGNPDGVTIRVDDERFRSTWRQHIIDKHPSEPYDDARLPAFLVQVESLMNTGDSS